VTRIPREHSKGPGKRPDKTGRPGKAAASEPTAIQHGALPSREVILRFIADHPQKASKRELAKAFGLKGDSRVELKQLLRDLEQEGMLQKTRKSLIRPGALPPVTVLDITTRDKDGELIGRPAEWPDEMGRRASGGHPPVVISRRAQRQGQRRLSPVWATGFWRKSFRRPIAVAPPIRRASSRCSTSGAAHCSASSRTRPVAADACYRSSGAAKRW
jgi:exoribonuclease R